LETLRRFVGAADMYRFQRDWEDWVLTLTQD
jgi:hypothetical protein